MSIRLIAFDLDGTLLKEDKTVSGRTMAALQNAADRGIYLVPSTGRVYDGMPDVVKNMPFVRYAITVNGAQIYDVKEKRILHRAELTRAESEAVFAYGRDWEAGVPAFEKYGEKDLRYRADDSEDSVLFPGNSGEEPETAGDEGAFSQSGDFHIPAEQH
ncbi:HAD family hydrolase [Candidatus Merdisoma sp. HCP28S3_D10]|uniref:HAD family hydrolase n=1 Tax=unclassified Candidatus Merdisoma TaxID=3099611 RepID=UPI003F8B63E1